MLLLFHKVMRLYKEKVAIRCQDVVPFNYQEMQISSLEIPQEFRKVITARLARPKEPTNLTSDATPLSEAIRNHVRRQRKVAFLEHRGTMVGSCM